MLPLLPNCCAGHHKADGTNTPNYNYEALAQVMRPFLQGGRLRWAEAQKTPETAASIQQAIGVVPGESVAEAVARFVKGGRGGGESTTDKLKSEISKLQ